MIWARLGRQPIATDTPTIAIEFVFAGKQNLTRDYELERHEYESIGIQEYWVFCRFDRTLTVFRPNADSTVLDETQTLQNVVSAGIRVGPGEAICRCRPMGLTLTVDGTASGGRSVIVRWFDKRHCLTIPPIQPFFSGTYGPVSKAFR